MSFIGICEVIVVVMISVGEIGCIVETFWMGDEVTWVSVMKFGVKMSIEETC